MREIQVIDFVRVTKPFADKQNMPQRIFKVEDDGSETELLRFNVADACPLEEMRELFKKLEKRFEHIHIHFKIIINTLQKDGRLQRNVSSVIQ